MNYELLIVLLLGVAVGAIIAWYVPKLGGKGKKKTSREVSSSAGPEGEVLAIARALTAFFNSTSHPSDLLTSANFLRGVDVLYHSDFSDDRLIQYSTGSNIVVSCMALEALQRRHLSEQAVVLIAGNMGVYYLWPIFFALRAITEDNDQPVVGAVLAQAQDWWLNDNFMPRFIEDFVSERLDNGEKPSFGSWLDEVDNQKTEYIKGFLSRLDSSRIEPLLEEIEQKHRTQLDESFLNAIGRLWTEESSDDVIVEHDQLMEQVDLIHKILFMDPSRSVLLVGESGVGKTVTIKSLARKLQKSEWYVFEAGAADIMAGQIFIGQAEQRVQDLVRHLDRRRQVLWFIPNFHEMYYAGRHRFSPIGILDMLLPFVDSGTIKVVGEVQPSAYERLVRENRKIGQSFEAVRIEPLSDAVTLELAESWIEKQRTPGGTEVAADPRKLREALSLAKQYLSEQVAPGNLLGLLNLTRRGLAWESSAFHELTPDDFIVTLTHMTGLPRSILDDREELNLEALRDLFNSRILGQAEAVDCLVERVAMIKAGLCDPTRPTGVFLFAGPTGTGKTEIVKALADFLFGSSDRMIRLDMSEFQTPNSLDRILGTPEMTADEGILTSQIRKQPFTVVLLDELEKANPNIWNLFLQVFDDGRLTDARGNTADFRHSIIIMTTNLGATIYSEMGIGFNPSASEFSMREVEQAIDKTFRKEFINRIDRIVIFHPLSRNTMRQILHNELKSILQRRGLRTKDWAVEWDDTAMEFLLNTGFTTDLGARPLKRAIERYLLSPLATTIVSHQAPEGDQFLFVRSDGNQINVEFVDPDAPEQASPATVDTEVTEAAGGDLRALILFQKGEASEVETLQTAYDKMLTTIETDDWEKRKNEAMQKTSGSDFWALEERFSILGEIEYMDRIETGLATAGSIIRRLKGSMNEDRTVFSRVLIRRLAQRLYLLRLAHIALIDSLPRDAYLKIEIIHESRGKIAKSNLAKSNLAPSTTEVAAQYALKLQDMYLKWARKRRMRFKELLVNRIDSGKSFQYILAVSGFGAYLILSPENGLHIFETPKTEKTFQRHSIRVRVVAQPDIPPQGSETLLSQAEDLFSADKDATPGIVRYYRDEPSPLVRDTSRKWRTGRLDLVLDGNFDLFGEASE